MPDHSQTSPNTPSTQNSINCHPRFSSLPNSSQFSKHPRISNPPAETSLFWLTTIWLMKRPWFSHPRQFPLLLFHSITLSPWVAFLPIFAFSTDAELYFAVLEADCTQLLFCFQFLVSVFHTSFGSGNFGRLFPYGPTFFFLWCYELLYVSLFDCRGFLLVLRRCRSSRGFNVFLLLDVGAFLSLFHPVWPIITLHEASVVQPLVFQNLLYHMPIWNLGPFIPISRFSTAPFPALRARSRRPPSFSKISPMQFWNPFLFGDQGAIQRQVA